MLVRQASLRVPTVTSGSPNRPPTKSDGLPRTAPTPSPSSPPTANSGPFGITAGPDGNLWFTESEANQLGRITPESPNIISEFPIPTLQSVPLGITAGPDGNFW